MNPDCAGGKHVACSGTAWDEKRDELVQCSCTCHHDHIWELALTEPVGRCVLCGEEQDVVFDNSTFWMGAGDKDHDHNGERGIA